jgi:hypothetical protein
MDVNRLLIAAGAFAPLVPVGFDRLADQQDRENIGDGPEQQYAHDDPAEYDERIRRREEACVEEKNTEFDGRNTEDEDNLCCKDKLLFDVSLCESPTTAKVRKPVQLAIRT